MNKVTIKTCIDASNPEHLIATAEFLRIIGGQSGRLITGTTQEAVAAPLEAVAEKTETVVKPKRTRKPKETPAVEKVEAPIEKVVEAVEKVEAPAVEKVETTETEWEKKGKEDKLVDLRAALGTKARAQLAPGLSAADLKKETELRDENRKAIKGKLEDVGAKNITLLKEGNYLEVLEFIKTCESLKPLG